MGLLSWVEKQLKDIDDVFANAMRVDLCEAVVFGRENLRP
jgi:hypothetical protein